MMLEWASTASGTFQQGAARLPLLCRPARPQVDPSVTFDTVGGLDHYIKVGQPAARRLETPCMRLSRMPSGAGLVCTP